MNPSRIHLLYAVGILTALLIGSLSVQWNSVKGLPEIFSFALGCASLILAIIAIFQSLNSTSTLSGLLGSLERSAAQIRDSASSIEGSAETVVSTTQSHTSTLSDVRDTLINKLTQPDGEEQREDHARAIAGGPTLEAALARNSFGGHISTYILAKASVSKKSFKGNKYFPGQPVYENYTNGFVAGLISTGVVGGSIHDDGLFTVSDIKGDATDIADRAKRILMTQSKNKDKAVEFISAIDAYFDGSSDEE